MTYGKFFEEEEVRKLLPDKVNLEIDLSIFDEERTPYEKENKYHLIMSIREHAKIKPADIISIKDIDSDEAIKLVKKIEVIRGIDGHCASVKISAENIKIHIDNDGFY